MFTHRFFRFLGKHLASYLNKPLPNYYHFSLINQESLKNTLRPGDVLLVEGNNRISVVIKYLTHSSWSHACIYLGDDEKAPLIEADLEKGVIRVPLNKYAQYNLRICRPVNLSKEDSQELISTVKSQLGFTYDLKNIFDLARYLMPLFPVPAHFRRHLIAFGSGDPTKAICSTLIAQAFQKIRYPILPRSVNTCAGEVHTIDDTHILENRHYSHFTPRDFDVSPYFAIIKPTIESGFDYHKLRWAEFSHAETLAELKQELSE